MEHKEPDRVVAFDTLFTNNQIRMMKVVMPLFAPSTQKQLAVYIKYMELKYTMSYFSKHNIPPFSGSCDTHNLFADILPYCSPEDKAKVKQMGNLFSMMENYQNMMEMMSMMKEMFPEGMPTEDMFSGFNMSGEPGNVTDSFGDMDLAGLMNLFQMFQK